MKIVVAGWRAARRDKHGEFIAEHLELVHDMMGHVRADTEDKDMTVVNGEGELSGFDPIVREVVHGWGWKFDGRGHERLERVPGTGTGNYKMMMREQPDLAVLFPGTACSDTREAYLWALRYGITVMAFPLVAAAKP